MGVMWCSLMRTRMRSLVARALACSIFPALVAGQSSTLKVTSSDGVPIPYAWVTFPGHADEIADAQGELNLGSARHKKFALVVRRIGYQPWSGTLRTPDTASVLTITLSRSARSPVPATADSSAPKRSELELDGFYDRWLRKMQGMSPTATYIGPEMIEQRKPRATTDLLDHVFGVTLVRSAKGVRGATGSAERPIDAYLRAMRVEPFRFGHECYMSIVLDGGPVCPPIGCHHVFADNPPGSSRDEHLVDLDKLVDVKQLIGIEVYPTKEAMPDEVLFEFEGCGLIVLWTGTRRP